MVVVKLIVVTKLLNRLRKTKYRGIFFLIHGVNGCFLVAVARNLWRKSLMKYGLWPEIIIFK
ncbi:hypothetical protein CIK88_02295 [Prevotella sp. P5-50]|nr:hypothetical protein CIK88_02295 [Prevotella sp. P5-50]